MEDVDWSFYLLKSCYLIHKIGRTIAEEPRQVDHKYAILSNQQQFFSDETQKKKEPDICSSSSILRLGISFLKMIII